MRLAISTLFGLMFARTLAAACNMECLSYCAYYYNSDSCILKCDCPEFASQSSQQQDLLKKTFKPTSLSLSAVAAPLLATPTQTATAPLPSLKTNSTATVPTPTVGTNSTTGKNTTATDSTKTEISSNTTTIPEPTPTNGTTTGGKNTTDPKPVDDGKNETVVDPALEESRQTCIATCTLKCKSESAEKKDACINLCFNQCTASIALVSTLSELMKAD